MRRHNPLLLIVLSAGTLAAADEPPRWWALFRDDSQVTAAAFQDGDWWEEKVALGGKRLFDPANPVRVVCDTTSKWAAAENYLLLANGDVLPGRLVKFLPDDDLPARVVVLPEPPLCTPQPEGLAVRADRVLRVLAAAKGGSAREPGTLVFADGRTVSFAALRWTERAVKALTETGIVAAAFDQLSDLHVAKVDLLGAVCQEGVYPPVESPGLVARLETAEGAALTYRPQMSRVSLARLHEGPRRGRKPSTEPVRHLCIQPSWALGPLMIPVGSVCRQSYRAANEVPLSLLPAQVIRQQSAIHPWPWCRNRNVRGEVLRSGTITADLGLGTHSYSEIAFDLPAGARQFTALVGLDASVGEGGCAACKVFADKPSGEPLYEGGLLRGGQQPVRVGPLAVEGVKRLVLVTDSAHQNRPAGAYPFDIGDHVDWLLPLVTVEKASGDRAELLRRFVPGWLPWTLLPADAERVTVAPYWEPSHECWVPQLRLQGAEPLTLSRKVPNISYANDLLEVVLGPAQKSVAERVELLVDGARLDPSAVNYMYAKPVHSRTSTEQRFRPPEFTGAVLVWDLQAYHDRPVELALRLLPQADAILWHRLALKGAIRDLPPDGKPLVPEVPLTSLKPIDVSARKGPVEPTPNRLPRPGKHAVPIRFLGRQFDNGYGMTVRSSLTFAVEPAYQQFVAVVGACDDRVGPFTVALDDRVVWSAETMDESDQAIQVRVDIPPGTQRLTIGIDGTPNLYGGIGAWANAGFMIEENSDAARR